MLQPFAWDEQERSHHDPCTQRTYYRAFSLQDTCYRVGDSVFLFPECDGMPLHLGRLEAAFEDASPGAVDPHCIEVRWFERVANLEAPSATGPSQDRELVELEDTDVNPMGCLAGKATIFRVHAYEEAEQLARITNDTDWFFCRGLFQQSTGEFVLYDTLPSMQAAAVPEDVGDSDEVCGTARPPKTSREAPKDLWEPPTKKRQKTQRASAAKDAAVAVAPAAAKGAAEQHDGPASAAAKGFDKGPGKQCVECGATQTPQWREGPAGPKTLCNACGVRYNRLRASKKNGNFPRPAKPKAPKHAARETAPIHSAAAAGAGPTSAQAELSEHQLARQEQHRQQHRQPAQQPWAQPQQQQQQQNTAGRPQRQAALLAANRTAAYARTGTFDGDGAEASGFVSSGSGAGFDDASWHSSESAEELSMHAQRMGPSSGSGMDLSAHGADGLAVRRGKQHARAGAPLSVDTGGGGALSAPLTSPPVATARAASAAASLVAMARQPDAAGPGINSQGQQVLPMTNAGPSSLPVMVPAAPAPPSTLSSAGSMLRGVVLRAVGLCPDVVGDFGNAFSDIEALQDRLPEGVVGQLRSVTEQVDMATSEVAAADAALQAAMQVVAARQKSADSARERASLSMDRLKACMSDVLQQYGGAASGGARCSTGAMPSQASNAGAAGLYASDSQPLIPAQPLLPSNSSGGQKALLDARGSWPHIDSEHVSLLDSNLFGGAADSGAALLDGFGSSLIKVRN